MSLKAKIEAVIYAAEEPVTLAQLASLLGEEAQAELNALAERQESLPLDEESAESDDSGEFADQDALNAETLGEAAPAPPQAPAELTSTLSSRPEAEQTGVPGARSLRDGVESSAEAERPAGESATETSQSTPDSEAASKAAASRTQDARRLRDYFRTLLDELIADYATPDRGLEIREVAGGFRLATKPEYHDAVRGFVKSLKPPLKLSLQALETLAVVAYKQPVTAPEVSEIRGVDSGGVLGSLMARKLVATAGRKQVIGRPILYKTTKDFLLRFGLKDLNELPSIEEFEKMAGEFAEAIQEEIPMPAQADETEATESPERRSEEDATAGEPYSDENLSEENPTASLVDPADNVEVDGRISGVPPNYAHSRHIEGDETDSPELDAQVQSAEGAEEDESA